MVTFLAVLTTILAALGVFFGQSGTSNRVTGIGYGILVLIIIVGILDISIKRSDERSSAAQAQFLEDELAQSNTQLLIQNIDLDRPFEQIRLTLQVRAVPCDDGACNPDYAFYPAHIAPFFPKQEIGSTVAEVTATIGETEERRFILTQRTSGFDVVQRLGSGELAGISMFTDQARNCQVIREPGSCDLMIIEDMDLLAAGVYIDISSDEAARRIVSDVLGSGSFRTETGAENYCILRTVVETARKQSWDVLRALSTSPVQLVRELNTLHQIQLDSVAG